MPRDRRADKLRRALNLPSINRRGRPKKPGKGSHSKILETMKLQFQEKRDEAGDLYMQAVARRQECVNLAEAIRVLEA